MFNPPLNFFPRRKGVDDNASQASNLVKGMVDYMRVLENRITDLESRNYDTASMGGDPDNRRQSTPEERIENVEPKAKFFDARAYMKVGGDFISVHKHPPADSGEIHTKEATATDPGHFM